MISLRFVVSVDGATGHDNFAFLQCLTYQWILSPGLGLDPLLDWSLLYVQIVRHHKLTCLRGSCVHWCSGTGINDGIGFPDFLLN